MQAFRNVASRLMARQTRSMTTKTAEDYWAPVFPKPHVGTEKEVQGAVRKELIGFFLLGPIGGGLMIYDFIYGLESHSDNIIPPYPW